MARMFALLLVLAVCALTVLATEAPAAAFVPAHRMVRRAKHHRDHKSSSGKSSKTSSASKSTKTASKSKSSSSSKSTNKVSVKGSSQSTADGAPLNGDLAAFAKKALAGDGCKVKLDNGGLKDGSGKDNHYCGDKKKDPSYVMWVSNMDVDCDGTKDCKNNPDYQAQTAAEFNGKFLNANKDHYVVVNDDSHFRFSDFGLKLKGAVTVVCNNRVFGAIIADTNPYGQIGEASISLAKACFPDQDIDGNHAPNGKVVYIAHTGADAVVTSLSPSSLAAKASQLVSKISF